MIEISAPRLPDSVAVSEQDAEVEVGFDAALNGKLLFPSLPRLLQGQRVPSRAEQVREHRMTRLVRLRGISVRGISVRARSVAAALRRVQRLGHLPGQSR